MSNIYEIASDLLYLQSMLEDPEIDPKLLADTMESVEGELEYKADQYARMMRNMESQINGIKAELERLTARKKALEANVDRMKDNLYTVMVNTGKRKFKTDLFSFNIQKNGGADPVIVDVATEDLPDECVIVSEKPDLKALAVLLKDPENSKHYAKFAHFGERGESLRIK